MSCLGATPGLIDAASGGKWHVNFDSMHRTLARCSQHLPA